MQESRQKAGVDGKDTPGESKLYMACRLDPCAMLNSYVFSIRASAPPFNSMRHCCNIALVVIALLLRLSGHLPASFCIGFDHGAICGLEAWAAAAGASCGISLETSSSCGWIRPCRLGFVCTTLPTSSDFEDTSRYGKTGVPSAEALQQYYFAKFSSLLLVNGHEPIIQEPCAW